MSKKYFTVNEANALLPNIREELQLLQETKHKIEQKYAMLKKLKALGEPVGNKDEDPFFELECEIEFLQIEARSQIHSFELKGVELKNIDIGLVDFPAVIEGEEVLLCWKQGEEGITHYHGYHDGFSGRKPLDDQ